MFNIFKKKSTIKLTADSHSDCKVITTNSVDGETVTYYRARLEGDFLGSVYLSGLKTDNGVFLDPGWVEGLIPLAWSHARNKREADRRLVSPGECAYIDLFAVKADGTKIPGTYKAWWPNSLKGILDKPRFILCLRVKTRDVIQDYEILFDGENLNVR